LMRKASTGVGGGERGGAGLIVGAKVKSLPQFAGGKKGRKPRDKRKQKNCVNEVNIRRRGSKRGGEGGDSGNFRQFRVPGFFPRMRPVWGYVKVENDEFREKGLGGGGQTGLALNREG